MNTPNLASLRVLRCAFNACFRARRAVVVTAAMIFPMLSASVMNGGTIEIALDPNLSGPRVKNVFNSLYVFNPRLLWGANADGLNNEDFLRARYPFLTTTTIVGAAGGEYGESEASGGSVLTFASNAVGDYITLNTTSLDAGSYRLSIVSKTANSRGILQVSFASNIGGAFTDTGPVIDQYSSGQLYKIEQFAGNIGFGLTNSRSIRFTVVGKNAASTGYGLNIDAIKFTPIDPVTLEPIEGGAIKVFEAENLVIASSSGDASQVLKGFTNTYQHAGTDPCTGQTTYTTGGANRDLYQDPANFAVLNDYDTAPLIQVLDNILLLGLKPNVKLGSVPIKLSQNNNGAKLSAKFLTNVRPPDEDKWDDYFAYTKKIIDDCVATYGLTEVRSWKWTFWTEIDNANMFLDHADEVDQLTPWDAPITRLAAFKLYDYTVAALESSLGAAFVNIGVHSMPQIPISTQSAPNEHKWNGLDLIDHCTEGTNYYSGTIGTQLDFWQVSWYELDITDTGDSGDFVDEYSTGGTLRFQSLIKTISDVRARAVAQGLSLEIGVDESGILVDPRPGAGALRQMRSTLGGPYHASWQAYLLKHALDLDLAQINLWSLNTEWVFKTEGLGIDREGQEVDHASTNAVQLAYKLAAEAGGDVRLSTGVTGTSNYSKNVVDAVAGWQPQSDKLRVLLFNHGTPYGDDYSAGSSVNVAESVSLVIKNVVATNGSNVAIKTWLLDNDHASFWKAWWTNSNRPGMILTDAFDVGGQCNANNYFNSIRSKYSSEVPFALKSGTSPLNYSAVKNAEWYDKIDAVIGGHGGYRNASLLSSAVTYSPINNNTLTISRAMAAHGVVLLEISGISVVGDSGLIGEWKCNEINGSILTDSSLSNASAMLQTGASRNAGQEGQGILLDGTSGYVSIPDSPNLTGMSALSVATWVKISAFPSSGKVFVPVGKDTSGQSYRLGIAPGGSGHFAVKTIDNGWYTAGTNISVPANTFKLNQWHHFVGTYDGSKVRVYVDGVIAGEASQSISGAIADSAAELRWGYGTEGGSTSPMLGRIDGVRLYSRALSAAEVSAHYRAKDLNPGLNLALSSTVTASSTNTPTHQIGYANDGAATIHGSSNSWSNSGNLPAWLAVDFGSVKTVRRIELYTPVGSELSDYQLQYHNGTTWVAIDADPDPAVSANYNVNNNTLAHRSHTFPPVTAQKIRVYCTKGPASLLNTARITELEVFEN